MNDSISVSSSSYSSSSQSNSLNRSSNSSYIMNMASSSATGNHRDSTGLGVSSSSGGTSPVIVVRHRRRRPRAKSQTSMPNYESFESSTTSSTSRPVSLTDDNSAHRVIGLIEHNKQLMEDMFVLKRQLKLKDEEIEKLTEVRNKLDSEMQELSASLFEQAYLMVNQARAETAQYEKLLKEANGKIDVLQAEVKALKELVLNTSNATSTPNKGSQRLFVKPGSHSRQSSLNQQTINQIIPVPASLSTPSNNNTVQLTSSTNNLSSGKPTPSAGLKHSSTSTQPLSASLGKSTGLLQAKHHRRLPSDQAKSFIDKLFHTSVGSLNSSSASQKSEKKLSREKYESLEQSVSIDINVYEQEAVEHDTAYYDELVEWRQKPEIIANSSPFLARIYAEDILPCLSFNNFKPNDELLASIQENRVCIEDISNHPTDQSMNRVCGLSNAPCICQYKIKLTENGQWIYISRLTRNRIISVCDFFTYLRYIKDGLVKSDVNEIYWNIIDLRRKMSLSRLGL